MRGSNIGGQAPALAVTNSNQSAAFGSAGTASVGGAAGASENGSQSYAGYGMVGMVSASSIIASASAGGNGTGNATGVTLAAGGIMTTGGSGGGGASAANGDTNGGSITPYSNTYSGVGPNFFPANFPGGTGVAGGGGAGVSGASYTNLTWVFFGGTGGGSASAGIGGRGGDGAIGCGGGGGGGGVTGGAGGNGGNGLVCITCWLGISMVEFIQGMLYNTTMTKGNRSNHPGKKCLPGCECGRHKGRAYDGELDYFNLHSLVKKVRGKATGYGCTFCNDFAKQWSQIHGLDGSDVWHYRPLCYSCHGVYDGTVGNLRPSPPCFPGCECAKHGLPGSPPCLPGCDCGKHNAPRKQPCLPGCTCGLHKGRVYNGTPRK